MIPRPPRRNGYLYCATCERAVSWYGYGDLVLDKEWPQHRCRGEIRDFTGFVDQAEVPV